MAIDGDAGPAEMPVHRDSEKGDSLRTRSPEWPLSSPDTPIAPVQFQHSVDALLANKLEGSSDDDPARSRHLGRSPLTEHSGIERPARSIHRETNPRRSSTQEPGSRSRKQTLAKSTGLNLHTTGGTSIDEHLHALRAERQNAGSFPSPPPSDANGSPILSPIEDIGELPVLLGPDGRHNAASNSRRERSASSALDFGTGLNPHPMPEISSTKDRTMSETRRPVATSRTQSTPMFRRKGSSSRTSESTAGLPRESATSRSTKDPSSSKMDRISGASKSSVRHDAQPPSPIPDSMPVPPLSMPTLLQLELSSSRPPPLYLYRPSTTDSLFEPTSVKAERLLNFLALPPQLERVLWFGTLACMDAWLYNFTILPLRFFLAVAKLIRSLLKNLWSEIVFLSEFVPLGLGRVWQRQVRGHLQSEPATPAPDGNFSRSPATSFPFPEAGVRSPPMLSRPGKNKRHRRTRSRSVASSLVSAEKADILKGCLIMASTVILMHFDASMMYHSIRGQAAIKLYVIYNVLEVFDRLLSAIGQDILECLFSPESLSRHANGRSKILRPLSLFPIALVYVLIHATALYYQVITLNVAVNSYSNALLTLLMSNQFVEIKSTVFKRIEKENLFQMTCADVVERFQLWLMLVIIAGRNIIETSAAAATAASKAAPPPSTSILLPFSFTLFPSVSFSQILNPFILVLGTETVVDWIKHAYITKFNNVKPNLYGRFVDVLAKDYYGNAFKDPNLTKRIGLPVIPLTCLAIRAAVQTYHMFREHFGNMPLAASMTTTFSSTTGLSPTTAAALRHIDSLFLKVVGETSNADDGTSGTWVLPSEIASQFLPAWVSPLLSSFPVPSTDTMIHWGWTILIIAVSYLVLLALKVMLGMALLRYARNRYTGMKAREQESTFQDGRRMGGWGMTELDEEKRRWIYVDDPERLKKLEKRDRDTREKEMGAGKGTGYDGVERYKLGGSKRIW